MVRHCNTISKNKKKQINSKWSSDSFNKILSVCLFVYRKPIPRGIMPRIMPRRIGGPLKPLGIEFMGPPLPNPRPLKMAERYVVLYLSPHQKKWVLLFIICIRFILWLYGKYSDNLTLLTCHVRRNRLWAFLLMSKIKCYSTTNLSLSVCEWSVENWKYALPPRPRNPPRIGGPGFDDPFSMVTISLNLFIFHWL